MMASFTATSTMPPSTTRGASAAMSARSRLMPTEIRNTPSSSPLNGSMVTSIWRRNSVSASSSPAISEPSSIGRPTTAVASPVARITSRHAATNSSGLPVRATLRNSGRSTSRPATITPSTTSTACTMAEVSALPTASDTPMTNSTGTAAISCNSSTGSDARPTGPPRRFSCDSTCTTTAVDDIDSAGPMTAASTGGAPRA